MIKIKPSEKSSGCYVEDWERKQNRVDNKGGIREAGDFFFFWKQKEVFM